LSISTYSELQAAVAEWLIRDDLTDRIPDFIMLAEKSMQRLLKTAEMEVETPLATVANNANVALPTGYSGLRNLRIYNNSIWYDVQILPLEPYLDNGVVGAPPVAASIVGNNLKFRPIPNAIYPLALDYYGKFTPLSDAAPTNWILDDHPDAYLYGALLQSAPYLGTDDRLSLWADGFNSVIQQINEEDVDKRFRNMKLRADVALTYPRRFNVYTGWGY
jgi:hypothetical protein